MTSSLPPAPGHTSWPRTARTLPALAWIWRAGSVMFTAIVKTSKRAKMTATPMIPPMPELRLLSSVSLFRLEETSQRQ
jgi:hypothetical protein